MENFDLSQNQENTNPSGTTPPSMGTISTTTQAPTNMTADTKTANTSTTASGLIQDGRFSDAYLKYGYCDSNGNVDCSYVLEYAEEIAVALKGAQRNILGKILDEVQHMGFAVTIEDKKKALAKRVAEVEKLVKQGLAPVILCDFMRKNYEAIKTQADFRSFCMHLEAVFCYLREPEPTTEWASTDNEKFEDLIYYVLRAGGQDDVYLVHIDKKIFIETSWTYQKIEIAVTGSNHVTVIDPENYNGAISREVTVTSDNGGLIIN